jgi:hypothetical protein
MCNSMLELGITQAAMLQVQKLVRITFLFVVINRESSTNIASESTPKPL